MSYSHTRGDKLGSGDTIDDLITELTTLKEEYGNLPIGTTGHFGEYYAMDKNDISVKFDVTSGKGWDGREAQWVDINSPDIGPDPD